MHVSYFSMKIYVVVEALLLSARCCFFCLRNKKKFNIFWVKKVPSPELCMRNQSLSTMDNKCPDQSAHLNLLA